MTEVEILSDDECWALLTGAVIGRLAYAVGDEVEIYPVNFLVRDRTVFFRTAPGSKLEAIGSRPKVAFEVDEVHGVFDWKSVVVHGTVYRMARDGSPPEVKLWAKGMALLKRIVAETGTPDDPVPFRTVVFGIHVDTISGRSSSTRARSQPRPRRDRATTG